MPPQELSAKLQDSAWTSYLKKVAVVLLLVVSGLATTIYYVSAKVDEKLRDMIQTVGVTITVVNDDEWWPIVSPLLFAVCGSMLILVICKLVIEKPRFLVKAAWFIVTCLGILLVAYPGVLTIQYLDCSDCQSGQKLDPWILAYSILFLLAGAYTFLQFCTVLEDARTGVFLFFDVTKFVPLKESRIPIIGMLTTMRRLTQGVFLFLSREDIVDALNRAHNTMWTISLSRVFFAYFLGTLFTFMSIVAHGCPSALEPKLKHVDKVWRASWTTAPTLLHACVRTCLLGYCYSLARLVDAISSANRNSSANGLPDSPFFVTIWAILLFSVLALVAFVLIIFILRPQVFHACAKHGQLIAERERIRPEDDDEDDEDDDDEMRTIRSSRSRASTLQNTQTSRLDNPALL